MLRTFNYNEPAIGDSIGSRLFNCTPVVSLNSAILLLSALFTLAIFRTRLFSLTCSLCCCSSVIGKVSAPYRHAGVTQVPMALLFSLFEIHRSAITRSTALHAFAPACALRRSHDDDDTCPYHQEITVGTS